MVFDVQTIGQLLIFGLTWGGLYALTANGLNIINGVTNILNLAHGELVMLSAYTMYWLFTIWGLNPIVSMLASAPVFFLLGMAIQRLVVYPIIKADPRIDRVERASLIVFFGVLLFLQNSALLIWSADYRVVTYLNEPLKFWKLSIAANRVDRAYCRRNRLSNPTFFPEEHLYGEGDQSNKSRQRGWNGFGNKPNLYGPVEFRARDCVAGISGSLAGLIYVITPTMGFIFTIKSFIVMLIGGPGQHHGHPHCRNLPGCF